PAADTTTNGYVFVGANFNYSVQAVISDTEGGKPLTDACAQAIYDAMFTIGVSENGFWITCSRAKPINLAPQLKNRPFRYGRDLHRLRSTTLRGTNVITCFRIC